MSKKKGHREEFKQEDILQGVVIADNFANTFTRLNLSTANPLVPLVNQPLLRYVLEFLSSAGVQEIFVFCKNHADEIKQFIQSTSFVGDSCEVNVVVSDSCFSFGDALREIDAKGLIRSDFVLVNTSIIANIPLKDIIQKHKERRKRDKTPVMTFLLSQIPPGHASRHRGDDVVLALNALTEKLLYYKKSSDIQKFNLPLSLLLEHSELQLHYNLLDPQIGICSPQVPLLFSENFDWLTWDNFVKGILDNEEILGNTIHGHIIERGYALQASSLLSYDSISKDIMHRWTYPLVPDQCDYLYHYKCHNIYQHEHSTTDRVILHEDVVIGRDTRIGADTQISQSVIGNNCVIGSHVKLNNTYLWDNVHIGDNCVLNRSLVASCVNIMNNAVVKNAVLAENVRIGENVTLPDNIVLVSAAVAKTLPEDECKRADPSVIGSEGAGYIYTCSNVSNQGTDDVDGLCDRLWAVDVTSDAESLLSDGTDSDDITSLAAHVQDEEEDDQTLFLDEVIGTLERATEEGISTDNLVLEVNSLKHAYNIQIKEVNDLVTRALLQLPLRKQPGITKTQYLTESKQLLRTFLPLLSNYIKSGASQMDCILALESEASENCLLNEVVTQLLHVLYQTDIILEDTAITWYKQMCEEGRSPKIATQVEPFITWLEEAEEESD